MQTTIVLRWMTWLIGFWHDDLSSQIQKISTFPWALSGQQYNGHNVERKEIYVHFSWKTFEYLIMTVRLYFGEFWLDNVLVLFGGKKHI